MLKNLMLRLLVSIKGTTSIEYGLIVMGLGIVIFATLAVVGGDISKAFDYLSNSFQARAL